jgi:carboxyl-terminal processing protease
VRELLGRIWTGALILSTVTVAYAAVEPLKPIQMDPKEPAISSNVTKLIEELHYSQPHLDNSLSSAILDRYLDTLDGNRMYFTATDIASFNRLRYELDDRTRQRRAAAGLRHVQPVPQARSERVDYAIKLLARSRTSPSTSPIAGIGACCRGPRRLPSSTRSGGRTSRAMRCASF